ncbi:tRNA (guanine(10)-N2)-methyltransferase [Astathelohania contejeani]|uniref:tRNA (Guanine(10)-N2)-methyltransferase n=1 Tax=Astathelohania contejeani TaxID=164912 RepID=A0ABQ7I0V4_9MICR|nr:tRNA (guanine(10)-N2)-methyltransferase [Thelohania contejeani]
MLFLIRYSNSYPEFQYLEVEWVLRHRGMPFLIVKREPPYEIIDSSIEAMEIICERCVFVRNVSYYLFDVSNIDELLELKDVKDLMIQARERKNFIGCVKNFYFGDKISAEKSKFIKDHFGMIFSKIDLVTPTDILELHFSTRIYGGLNFKSSNRKYFLGFHVEKRPFIGHTSMDLELSIFMANICNIGINSIVYDPCAGSGSILLACSLLGAFVFGSDIDSRQYVGENIFKNNVKTRLKGTNIYTNFIHYNNTTSVLGFNIADLFSIPFIRPHTLDCILVDPPYGIRASLKKNINEYIEEIGKLGVELLIENGYLGIWIPEGVEFKLDGYEEIISVRQRLASYTRMMCVYKKI